MEGFDLGHPDTCSEFWRRELLFEDVNLYRDVARARVPVAALQATARDPGQAGVAGGSCAHGFDDELRGGARVDGSPWGSITLLRREGQAAFATATRLVASLSAPLGEALGSAPARPSRWASSGTTGQACSCSTGPARWSRPTSRPGRGWPSYRPAWSCPATSASRCRCGCWPRCSGQPRQLVAEHDEPVHFEDVVHVDAAT